MRDGGWRQRGSVREQSGEKRKIRRTPHMCFLTGQKRFERKGLTWPMTAKPHSPMRDFTSVAAMTAAALRRRD